MNIHLGILAVVGGLWLSGCVSTGMARTVNKGQLQVSVVPGVHAELDREGSDDIAIPYVELGVRYGVTDRLDVGARLFSLGAAADVRLGLVRAPSLDSGLDLTLAPSFAVVVRSSENLYGIAELPLLLGLNPGRGVQVVLGPRVGAAFDIVPRGPGGPQVLVGGSFGVAVPLGQRLYLVPEVIVRTSVSNPLPLVQGNLGLLIGGYR